MAGTKSTVTGDDFYGAYDAQEQRARRTVGLTCCIRSFFDNFDVLFFPFSSH